MKPTIKIDDLTPEMKDTNDVKGGYEWKLQNAYVVSYSIGGAAASEAAGGPNVLQRRLEH